MVDRLALQIDRSRRHLAENRPDRPIRTQPSVAVAVWAENRGTLGMVVPSTFRSVHPRESHSMKISRASRLFTQAERTSNRRLAAPLPGSGNLGLAVARHEIQRTELRLALVLGGIGSEVKTALKVSRTSLGTFRATYRPITASFPGMTASVASPGVGSIVTIAPGK